MRITPEIELYKKTEDYIQDAVDFLDDKDAPKNKMRRYMEHIR